MIFFSWPLLIFLYNNILMSTVNLLKLINEKLANVVIDLTNNKYFVEISDNEAGVNIIMESGRHGDRPHFKSHKITYHFFFCNNFSGNHVNIPRENIGSFILFCSPFSFFRKKKGKESR